MTSLLWIVLAALAGLVALTWIMLRPVRGLYLAFFATAILLTPSLPVLREKFALTEALMLLTWAGFMLHPAVAPGPGRGGTLPLGHAQRYALLGGGAFTAVVLLSFAVNNAVYREAFTASLVETANFVYGFLMFATVVWLVDSWDKIWGCLAAWLLGAVVVSAVGVWTVAGGAPDWAFDEFTGRVSSTLKFDNQVPSFLLPVFPAALFMALMPGPWPWARAALWAQLGAMLVTVFATGSRTALLMLAVCFAGAFYVAGREARHRAFQPTLLTITALLLAGGVIVFVVHVVSTYQGDYALGKTPPWERPIVTLVDWLHGDRPLDTTRAAQLEVVADSWLDYGVLGIGPKLSGPRLHTAEIHNTYLGVLIETGLAGLLLFLVWLAQVVLVGWQAAAGCPLPRERVIGLALLFGFAALLIYSAFMFGLRQRNLWLLAGLLVAMPRANLMAMAAPAIRAADRAVLRPRSAWVR